MEMHEVLNVVLNQSITDSRQFGEKDKNTSMDPPKRKAHLKVYTIFIGLSDGD